MERTLNAVDAAGNSWDFSFASNSALTNEVFTSPRLCDSACQTNALARLVDTYSRPVGYNLAIDGCPRSRVRYGYDAEGRIATLVATNAANRGFQVSYLNEAGYNYGYTLTTPNGATLTRTVTRDPYRRSLTLDCTTRFNNVEVASFAYTFDAGNRPVTRNNDRFAYNERDEITSALIGTNNINRAYDTIGNHVFCAFNSATNFYANNQLNQTTASYRCAPTSTSDDATPQDAVTPPLFDGYDILSTNKFTWSAQGGLLRDGRFIYAFDAEGQLTSVTSSRLTNGAIRVENKYDYRHRRISKTVKVMVDDTPPDSPGAPPLPATHQSWHLQERHDFVYDDWNLIHETITTVDANSATNVTEIEYFWGPDLSNTLQGAGGVGGLLAVSMNGVFYFPVYDNLGNIVKYLDESGTVVASYDYDDFGRVISSFGSMSNILVIRFSTKYLDSEIDFYYYGYRFYSLLSRCWINRDPIGETRDVNLYCAFGNNTHVYFDGMGCFTIKYETDHDNNLWERMLNKGEILSVIEVTKVEDIHVANAVMDPWGVFFAQLTFEDSCRARVDLEIYLQPRLELEIKKGMRYESLPHKEGGMGRDGYLHSSNQYLPLRDAILAHERGHARAFLYSTKAVFEKSISHLLPIGSLTKSQQDEVEREFKKAKVITDKDSASFSCEDERKWYEANGFSVIEKGGIYVVSY